MASSLTSRPNTNFLYNFYIGPRFFIFTLVLFVALITVITLVYSTKQVTKGYVLNALDAEHQELIKVREVKDMEISKVRSLNYIQESEKMSKMVRPRSVVYVNGGSTIASR
ncbi:hypothetical protein GF354_05675 [Candidatus Peregrinibacteria bacterium]|nr:hypothetical protein [Candidatus Peregrinibacteria bacterium]